MEAPCQVQISGNLSWIDSVGHDEMNALPRTSLTPAVDLSLRVFPNEGCRQKVIINMSRQKIQGLRSRLVRSVWRLDLCSASLHGQRVGSSMTESASESCNEDLTHPNDDRNAGMPLYGLSVIMILNRFVATNIPPGPQWILWCFVGQGRWM